MAMSSAEKVSLAVLGWSCPAKMEAYCALIDLSEDYSELFIDLEKLFAPLGTSFYPSE